MSWAEVKKINSDLSMPLDELIRQNIDLTEKVYSAIGRRTIFKWDTSETLGSFKQDVFIEGLKGSVSSGITSSNVSINSTGVTSESFDFTNISNISISYTLGSQSVIAMGLGGNKDETLDVTIVSGTFNPSGTITDSLNVASLTGEYFVKIKGTGFADISVVSIKLDGVEVLNRAALSGNSVIANLETAIRSPVYSPSAIGAWDLLIMFAEGDITCDLYDINNNLLASNLRNNAYIGEYLFGKPSAKLVINMPSGSILYNIGFVYIN